MKLAVPRSAVVSTRFLLRAFRSSLPQLALDQQASPDCALYVLLCGDMKSLRPRSHLAILFYDQLSSLTVISQGRDPTTLMRRGPVGTVV